jgi:hypothetical protein
MAGGMACLLLLGVAVVRAEPPPPPDWLLALESAGGEVPDDLAEGGVLEILPGDPAATVPVDTAAPIDPAAVPPVDPAAPPPLLSDTPIIPVDVGKVTALGDSVMLGAGPVLAAKFNNNAHVDAAVGRQVGTGIGLLQTWRDLAFLGDTVIVHLGNNGTFTAEQFDQIANLLAGVPRVVIVNNKVPRGWEGPNNEVIVNGVARHPNVMYVDWYAHSVGHPEWFYDDGYHLRPEGQRQYAELISTALVP